MDAISQIVAVTGTPRGAVVTYVFRQRAARRVEATQRAQRLREERLEAYGAYAGLLLTDNAELVVHADQAFAATGKIDRATDRDHVVARRNETRELIDRYLTTARRSLAVAASRS